MTNTVTWDELTEDQKADVLKRRQEKGQATSTVHVTFVVDRSGSMQSVRNDVIGGFNSFLDDQRNGDGVCLLTLHQFDSGGFETLHSARNVIDVPKAGSGDFVPRGSTPLYDAIGQAITEAQVRLERTGNRDEQQLVVILTDGYENASKEYDQAKVKALITAKEAEGWIFTFLGANIDSYAVSQNLGMSAGATMDFVQDSQGVSTAYACVSDATHHVRSMRAGGQSVSSAALYSTVGKKAEDDKKRRTPSK